jgi:hypothetical protein
VNAADIEKCKVQVSKTYKEDFVVKMTTVNEREKTEVGRSTYRQN